LRETTSFDVLIVNIGAGVLAVEKRKDPKKINWPIHSVRARAGLGARGRGAETPDRIVMKFCTGVGVPDVITHAKFGDHRFRGF